MARKQNHCSPLNPYEEKIKELQEELNRSRHTILSLMKEEIKELLTSYYSCECRKDTWGWEHRTAEKIVEHATLLPPQYLYSSDRAFCPLCKAGSSSPYDTGFTIPEGLHRHLKGWGNVRQCEVFQAAETLAREYWHHKFFTDEEKKRAENQKVILERRKTEILYKLGPNEELRLIDETIGYGAVSRTPNELTWAESRLSSLGFQIVCEANAKSYINEGENFVVFADPRAKGEITFTIYEKPIPKRARPKWSHIFQIKDNWKNDICEKYENRLRQGLSNHLKQ